MAVSEKIDNFITYFKWHSEQINKVPDPLYTRILWVTAFDALSVAASPELKRDNKKRFISFLVDFAKWKHCERVSMPQLKLDLDKPECHQGKLYERIDSSISCWSPGTLYGPQFDPLANELYALSASSYEEKMIKRCRYQDRFWAYRNNLVHGFRPPGRAFDANTDSDENEPYYMSHGRVVCGEIKDDSWELAFPLGLFHMLMEAALDNLQKELLQQNRNPYEAYDFDSSWFENDR